MTTVINCSDKTIKYDVYIGRPSKWGNPFKIGQDGTREEVIKKYEEWLLGQRSHDCRKRPSKDAAKKELKGRILGCYCKPLACHGDVLVRLLDE